MFEAYAFLAVFAIQILAMSVLHPTRFIKYLRAKISPVGHDAQLYVERRLTQFRALNTVVALLGLLLFGWLVSYMQDPAWDDGPIEALVGVYFVVQMLPVCFVGWIVAKINKSLTLSSPKRTASLQRRRLFDFVSPSTIALAALVYVLFAALVLYIEHAPFPGFAGAPINIGIVTLGYAFVSLGVYTILYRTRSNPLETYAERMHSIGFGVRIAIYTCIGAVVAVALNMTLVLLDSQRWEPFALTAFNVIVALAFTFSTRPNLPGDADAHGLGSNPGH
jgi:hypothetical protein